MDERMCHIIVFAYRAFLTLGERNLVNQGIALSHTSESNVLVNKIQIAKKKTKNSGTGNVVKWTKEYATSSLLYIRHFSHWASKTW
jgi:hypothetical protein